MTHTMTEKLKEALERLANAADQYGIQHLDTDDLDEDAEELQAATLAARDALTAWNTRPSVGEPVFGRAALDNPTERMIDAGLEHNHRHNSAENMVASFKAMVAQAEIDGDIATGTRPSVVPDREGVARVIDPDAFVDTDRMGPNTARFLIEHRDATLAKADAILSLLASQEG